MSHLMMAANLVLALCLGLLAAPPTAARHVDVDLKCVACEVVANQLDGFAEVCVMVTRRRASRLQARFFGAPQIASSPASAHGGVRLKRSAAVLVTCTGARRPAG